MGRISLKQSAALALSLILLWPSPKLRAFDGPGTGCLRKAFSSRIGETLKQFLHQKAAEKRLGRRITSYEANKFYQAHRTGTRGSTGEYSARVIAAKARIAKRGMIGPRPRRLSAREKLQMRRERRLLLTKDAKGRSVLGFKHNEKEARAAKHHAWEQKLEEDTKRRIIRLLDWGDRRDWKVVRLTDKSKSSTLAEGKPRRSYSSRNGRITIGETFDEDTGELIHEEVVVWVNRGRKRLFFERDAAGTFRSFDPSKNAPKSEEVFIRAGGEELKPISVEQARTLASQKQNRGQLEFYTRRPGGELRRARDCSSCHKAIGHTEEAVEFDLPARHGLRNELGSDAYEVDFFEPTAGRNVGRPKRIRHEWSSRAADLDWRQIPSGSQYFLQLKGEKGSPLQFTFRRVDNGILFVEVAGWQFEFAIDQVIILGKILAPEWRP